MRAAWWLILLLIPSASAVPVDLYVHVNGQQDAAMALSAPPATFRDDVSTGLMSTSGCVDDPTGTTTLAGRSYHEWSLYLLAAEVDYEDGRPRSWPAQGFQEALTIAAGDHVLDWYLSTRAGENDYTGIVPRVQLDVQVYAADHYTGAFQSERRLLFEGRLGPVDLAPGMTGAVDHRVVDGTDVYGFHMQMPSTAHMLRAGEFLTVAMRAAMDEPFCGDGRMLMPDLIDVHTSADARPMFHTFMENTVKLRPVTFSFDDHGIGLRIMATSPLGPYHLSNDTWLQDDAGLGLQRIPYQQYHCHCDEDPYTSRIQVYSWNFTSATDGTHDLPIRVSSAHGLGNATTVLRLSVHDGVASVCEADACFEHDPSVESPLFPVALLAGALLALARRQA